MCGRLSGQNENVPCSRRRTIATGERLLVRQKLEHGGCEKRLTGSAIRGTFKGRARGLESQALAWVQPERLADAILDAFSEAFRFGKDEFTIPASIGIALFPIDTDSCEELIKSADQAMYLVKKSGRNNYTFFTGTK